MLMSHTEQCSMLRGPDGLCRSFPQAFYRPFQRADVHQHTAPVLRPPCQALSSTMRVCMEGAPHESVQCTYQGASSPDMGHASSLNQGAVH